MKIVFTVATYWPLADGVQMVTQYQAEGLVKKGHEVIVVTGMADGLTDKEIHNDITIYRVNAHNSSIKHQGNKEEYISLVKELCSDADALIAVCLHSFSADWLLDDLDSFTCKKILYLHGLSDLKIHKEDFSNFRSGVKTAARKISRQHFFKTNMEKIKKFDAVTHLFENDSSHRFFLEHGYTNNYIIENACQDEFFVDASVCSTSSKYFLCVGSYSERKKQENALLAFYKADTKDFSLILIGNTENDYCKKLEQLKENYDKQYGNKDVKILFDVPRSEIISYTINSYACLMSSTHEYFPIVLIEGLASGKPFISTNVGIVRYLPGGVIASNTSDLTYWINFMIRFPDFTSMLGNIGQDYAQQRMRIEEKVNDLEKIILG